MGAHPNAMIMAVLTLDQGMRKTERLIFEHCEDRKIECSLEGGTIKILNGKRGNPNPPEWPEGYPLTDDWSVQVMESDYEEGYQISAKEGQIVIHGYLTYEYGETVKWVELEAQKKQLMDLLDPMTKDLEFTYEIVIGANYW